MRSELVPERRVDKNGKSSVRHVRAAAPVTGQRKPSLPPPPPPGALPRSNPSASVRLTVKQRQKVECSFHHARHFPDEQLKSLIVPVPMEKYESYYWTGSDAEAYDLISCVSLDDAIVLAHGGYTTKNAALGFLREHGLDRLLTDNTDLAGEALRRRIGFQHLLKRHESHRVENTDRRVFLDAAEARSSATLRDLPGHLGNRIVDDILAGKLSMDDIHAVGISRIAKSNISEPVINALGKVHTGEAPHLTGEQVRRIMDKCDDETMLSNVGETALLLAEEYGGDFVLGQFRLSRTAEMISYLSGSRMSRAPKFDEKLRSLLEYNTVYDRIMDRQPPARLGTILRLHAEGVPAEQGAELLAAGRTVEQIIATVREGIQPNLSDGWL